MSLDLLREELTRAARPGGQPSGLGRVRRWARRAWVQGRMAAARRLVQATGLSRGVIDLPAFSGTFELDLRSHITWRVLGGRMEPREVALVRAALAGQVGDAVDVGAHAGLYAVLLSRLVGSGGRVLAVEPTPGAGALLRSNLQRNGCDRALVFAGACGAAPGQLTLEVVEGNEEYASLGGIRHPNAPAGARRIQVPVRRLDDLVAEHNLQPVLLKIDVEGGEGQVLAGAGETLRRYRPVVFAELDHRLTEAGGPAQVVLGLREAGYDVFDLDRGRPIEDVAHFVGDLVALPRGR